MKRKIYQQLLDWKQNRRGDVALLIEGARRIGKSYIVEKFAQTEYDSYLFVDFSRVNPKVIEFFELYMDDIDMLLSSLELYGKKKLTPRKNADEEAHSLVIFDEIQFCPRARAVIKHLVADRRYDYIETGSLISIKKNVKDIMLPSEEHAIEMFPMDFEEFLWAMGDEMMMPYIQNQFAKQQPMGGFHRRALDYFRKYMIVGGMPQAVQTYVETGDFNQVDERKRDILGLYRNDIRKYADNQETKVAAIFDEIPGQLQKHEKKFKLADLQLEARMRNYSEAFFWLSDAKIINCCYNSTEPSMLVENIVAQMLRAAGHKLYFFSKPSAKEAEDRMEIDFLISKPTVTSRHNISPIEVKSGKKYTLTSLNKCINKYGKQLATPYVLHDKDLKIEDGIVYLPLYMTPLL